MVADQSEPALQGAVAFGCVLSYGHPAFSNAVMRRIVRRGAAMTTSDMPEGSESRLGGYRVEGVLGRGGMGVVYRARDVALGRSVALKLLAPELAADDRFRERFLRESRLAASLDHPAIVPIYEAGEVGGQLYIAMRLVDGTDLKRLLAESGGALASERALDLL